MEEVVCIKMLKALGDATRWRIVRELLANTLTVNELTTRVNATPYNVSKHLRILREAGIVETEKQGVNLYCQVAEAFRQRLASNRSQLDLGCCTFRFDQPVKSVSGPEVGPTRDPASKGPASAVRLLRIARSGRTAPGSVRRGGSEAG